MGFDALAGMSCEQLYAFYAEKMKALRKLMHLPRKFLRKLIQFLRYPFNRASALLNKYANMVGSVIADFMNMIKSGVVGDILDVLYNMAACPFLWNMFGTLIQSIISAIEQGLGLPMAMFNNLRNAIVGRVNMLLNKMKNMITNPIESLYKKYDALLNSTGVKAILQVLADIQKCIGSMCGAYNTIKPYIAGDFPDPFDALGVKIETDKDGNVSIGLNLDEKANNFATRTAKKVKHTINHTKKAAKDVLELPSKAQATAGKAWTELKAQVDTLASLEIPAVM